MLDHLPTWVLTESVDVTLTQSDPSIYLVERATWTNKVQVPAAITLTINENLVLVNGVYVDLGDDLMSVCSLIDDVAESALAEGQESIPVGVTYRSEPYSEGE